MKKRNLLLETPRVLVLDAYDSSVARNIIGGVLAYARDFARWNVGICTGHVDETPFNMSMIHRRYDGIILGSRLIKTYRDSLSRVRCPIVLVDVQDGTASKYGFLSRCPMVKLDERSTATVAGEFMLRNPYGEIAFVGEPQRFEWSMARERLFVEYLRLHGHSCLVCPTKDLDYLSDIKRLRTFIAMAPKPLRVFASSDSRAFTVASVCADLRLSIPKGVAILGVDNDEMYCRDSSPTLSSVRIDHAGGGMKAAEELDALMRHKHRSVRKNIWFNAIEVVERESTVLPSVNVNPVAKRIREFVAANASEPINVEEVVSALGIPRRTAVRCFAAEYGRTILDEIRDRRFAIARESMRMSPTTLATLAQRCGYSSELHLRREMNSRGIQSVKELCGSK